MKKGVIITIVALAVVIVAVAGFFILRKGTGEGAKDTGITTIIHKDFRLSINSSWQEISASSAVYFYFPPNISQDNPNAEYISLTESRLGDSNISLNQLLEQGIAQSTKIMPDFALAENNAFSNGNFEGREIKFSGTQQNITRNYDQVFGKTNGMLFSITHVCPLGNCRYQAVFDKVTQTFEPLVNP